MGAGYRGSLGTSQAGEVEEVGFGCGRGSGADGPRSAQCACAGRGGEIDASFFPPLPRF